MGSERVVTLTVFVLWLAAFSRHCIRKQDLRCFARRLDSLANEISHFVFYHQEHENNRSMNRLHSLVSITCERLEEMRPDAALTTFKEIGQCDMIRFFDRKFRENDEVCSFYVSYLITLAELMRRLYPIKTFMLRKSGHDPAIVAACYFQSL